MPKLSKPTLALIAVLSAAACGKAGPEQAAPPPVAVQVVTVGAEALPNIIELPGRIEAVRSAEVRARTAGIVLRRLYTEGTDVQAGAPLFEIDPREARAQVQQARAAVERAVAVQANAASVAQRYERLIVDRSVSAQEYEAAVAQSRQTTAAVAEARATLAQSELQLSYTIIRAPIAGRVGRAEVTEGALVSGAEGTLMTRIDQMAPVYAVFSQSNSAALNAMAEAGSRVSISSNAPSRVRLILSNGSDYDVVGRLDFAGQSVDPSTGSQTVRAVFDNPQRLLRPGQFVRGRIEAGVMEAGLAVPQRAVQFSGSQASVVVIGEDGATAVRPVKLGAMVGDRWAVTSGLQAGERIIVEGWQKVRPGQKVTVLAPTQAPTPTQAAAQPAAPTLAAGGR